MLQLVHYKPKTSINIPQFPYSAPLQSIDLEYFVDSANLDLKNLQFDGKDRV